MDIKRDSNSKNNLQKKKVEGLHYQFLKLYKFILIRVCSIDKRIDK